MKQQANYRNKKLFDYGVNYYEEIFTCTKCGRKVSLDYSYSNRGHNLICCGCIDKHYGSVENAVRQYIYKD